MCILQQPPTYLFQVDITLEVDICVLHWHTKCNSKVTLNRRERGIERMNRDILLSNDRRTRGYNCTLKRLDI